MSPIFSKKEFGNATCIAAVLARSLSFMRVIALLATRTKGIPLRCVIVYPRNLRDPGLATVYSGPLGLAKGSTIHLNFMSSCEGGM